MLLGYKCQLSIEIPFAHTENRRFAILFCNGMHSNIAEFGKDFDVIIIKKFKSNKVTELKFILIS